MLDRDFWLASPSAGVEIVKRIGRKVLDFSKDRAGGPTVEFAVITPFALLLLLGGFDLGRFILATQRTEAVANSVAEMIAQTGASSSATTKGDGLLYWNDLDFFQNSAMFTFPDALTEATQMGVSWWNLLNVNMSYISFTATPSGCTSNCTYTPKVVWGNGARVCGTVFTSVPDASVYSPSTLPADVYGPGSLIVVDVIYTWYPTFGASYMGSVTIERSVFMPPRNVPNIEYSQNGATGSGPISQCN